MPATSQTVDVDVDDEPGRARTCAEGQGPAQGRADDSLELADVAEDEGPQEVARVEGAITRNGSTLSVPPERNMSAWSMWLAPATMACIRVTLRPGPAPPTLPVSCTLAFTRRSSSRRTATVPTSSSPALATRFGSSKRHSNAVDGVRYSTH